MEESDLPFAGNVNPRAQLNKDHLFCEGDERYVGSSVYVPSSFPDTLPSDGWFILGSHGYAENAAGEYKGSSPGSLHMVPGSSGVTRFGYRQDESYNFAELWRGPSVQENKWYDFVFHIKFSRDASVGFVELWVDGELQTLTDGSTRAYYRTLKDGTVGCGSLIRTQYRKEMMGLPDPTTIYHDQVKVGTSYTEVAP